MSYIHNGFEHGASADLSLDKTRSLVDSIGKLIQSIFFVILFRKYAYRVEVNVSEAIFQINRSWKREANAVRVVGGYLIDHDRHQSLSVLDFGFRIHYCAPI